jgi:heat shock protein HslJ
VRFFVSLAAVVVIATVSGCGGDEDGDEDGSLGASSLEDVPWVLASGIDIEGWEEVAPSATFEDGKVAGSTGCNRFSGSYTIDGDVLELGQIVSTRMACPAPADAVEREFVAALERVAAWSVEDDELALHDGDHEEVLRFTGATPVGTWEATGILQENAVSSPIAGTEITASFAESGALTGSAGCNTYTATYTTDRGAIEIAQPAATEMACSEPAGVMEPEAAYLAALPNAVRYRISGRSLELLTAEGTLVVTYARSETSGP